MGILDDYFSNKTSNDASSTVAKTTAPSVLNDYFNAPDAHMLPAITIGEPPKPPISGATKEQSDIINAQPAQQGGINPRSQEPFPLSPRAIIPNIAGAVADQAVAGAKNFSGGLGDVVNQGQLGAGAKRMGIGA